MLHSRVRPLPRSAEKSTGTNDKGSTAQAPGLFGTHEDENKENDEDAEDIFAAFLPHLLPDDAPQFHGDPGQLLRYDSPLYGPLTIMVPHYPGKSEENKRTGAELSRDNQPTNEVDEGRKLFAHFLWSSAMVVAQGVEDADAIEKKSGSKSIDRTMWNVKGHRVLELGAGTGLPSIISVLASASHVTITDHPSSPAFLGAIEHNIIKNVPASLRPNIDSAPHEWGVLENDEFAQKNKGGFTRIIAADCLGRAIVANFFETAVAMGLEIESIYERDLNAGEEEAAKAEQGEVRRAWEPVRVGEGPENRRRWCVIAILKRAKS